MQVEAAIENERCFLSSRCTKLCDQTLVRLRPEITFTNPEKRGKRKEEMKSFFKITAVT